MNPPAPDPTGIAWIARPRAALGVVGLFLAVGAALSFLPYRDPPVVSRAEFTLIGSDREDVACQSAEVVQGFRCGFAPDGHPVALDEAMRLQPFQTLDRRTFLVPGLFRQPAVADRLGREPPDTPREKRERFTVRCVPNEIGSFNGFSLRWVADSPWSAPQSAPVATVSDCELLD
jgi:hypothetical protein